MSSRRRAGTVLGWIAGGAAGLLLNLLIFHLVDDYPVQPTSFGLFILGAFAGMALADRLGDRAVKVMGLATGLVIAALLTAVVLLSSG